MSHPELGAGRDDGREKVSGELAAALEPVEQTLDRIALPGTAPVGHRVPCQGHTEEQRRHAGLVRDLPDAAGTNLTGRPLAPTMT